LHNKKESPSRLSDRRIDLAYQIQMQQVFNHDKSSGMRYDGDGDGDGRHAHEDDSRHRITLDIKMPSNFAKDLDLHTMPISR
jgi:hypothetical protein